MPIPSGTSNWSPSPVAVSPGVFTRQNDLSGLAQGVADIGGVVVAPFAKGPGFSPTLCKSQAELQSLFGVPDGKYYGPYTAQQYLNEKGFVTVCRVGALTGYHQKYPLFVWAEKGMWNRVSQTAYFPFSSSTMETTGLSYVNVLQTTTSGTASYSGSVVFSNQSVALKLSGSSFYNEVTINGYLNGSVGFSGSLNVPTASATSASILAAILSGKLAGSVINPTFVGTAPFDAITSMTAYVTQSVDNCGNYIVHPTGSLTANIGDYDGTWTGGTGTFNTCSGQWVMSGSEYKVLAVLADTQYGGINTDLEAPGFYGTSQSYSPVWSGSVAGATSAGLTFNLELSQSNAGGYGTYNYSLDPSSPKYITNVFGDDATVGNPDDYVAGTKIEAAYLYSIFEDDIQVVADAPSQWKIHADAMPTSELNGEALKFKDQYSLDLLAGDSAYGLTNAVTPWVLSQAIAPWNGGNSTRFPLFRLWTRADGTNTNTSYKIEISNVKLAGTVAGSDWGSFTLSVRDFSDTEKKTKIIEQFNNLSLDPDSPNFIARRIGDRYNYIQFNGKIIEFGTYDNLSKYIYVEMTPNNYPITSVPYGFQAMTTPVNGAMGYHCNPVAYTKASVYGLFPGKYASGVDFSGPPAGADAELTALYPSSSVGGEHWRDNLQYFAPVPEDAGVGQNTIFALDEEITANGVSVGSYISGSNIVPATYDAVNESTYVKMRKFVFGFQGGFDGQSPSIPINVGADISAGNTQGLNCASSTTAGSIAYNQCIGALSNQDEFDINLIATPGILYSLHSYVTNQVVEMCEKRQDCFYIADLYKDSGNPATGQIDEVVNLAGEFDTSYAATYYPWIKIKDTNINKIVTVPPSVIMPAIYAGNDKVAGEWYAPAGLNRGGIVQAVQVTDRTTHEERDTLYAGKVNPIAAFPGQGISAWGQKTLQNKASALDRINVQRLLIEIKKYLASVSKYLVFEQNTAQTRNKFLAIANPYLEGIQQRQGLYAFEVIMDETNNTADLIDQNILLGQIRLQPTKTAEFILLDFSILPTGGSFSVS